MKVTHRLNQRMVALPRALKHPWQIRTITRIWLAALLLLAFVLPYEIVEPWVHFGTAFVLTNVELVAIVTLALWLLHLLAVRQFPALNALLGISIFLVLAALG